jgi:hypothetical protein
MITFLVTGEHAYTIAPLKKGYGVPVPEVASVSYAEITREATLPSGTYIFSDLERLSDAELLWASDLFRCISASPGSRALNDPARVRVRYGLLRALHAAGLNGFDAYRADGVPRPARFPVFVRRQSDHDAALSDLLPDQEALDACLEVLMAKGESLRGLVVIEFCAEPVGPGVFRRYGAFRVGDAVHLDHVVTQDSWNVKGGAAGLATEEMYRQDDADIRANRFADAMRRAFEIAGIDYGRADFGVVEGRPQVYEINTNPSMSLPPHHSSKMRSATLAVRARALCRAAVADRPPGDRPAHRPGNTPAGRPARQRRERRRMDPRTGARAGRAACVCRPPGGADRGHAEEHVLAGDGAAAPDVGGLAPPAAAAGLSEGAMRCPAGLARRAPTSAVVRCVEFLRSQAVIGAGDEAARRGPFAEGGGHRLGA